MNERNVYQINVICGNDDGLISIYDFTKVINELYANVDNKTFAESKPLSFGYNPYHNAQGKYIRKFDFFRALWNHGNSKTMFDSIPESVAPSRAGSIAQIDTKLLNSLIVDGDDDNDNNNNSNNNSSSLMPSEDTPSYHFEPSFFNQNNNSNTQNDFSFVSNEASPTYNSKPSFFSKDNKYDNSNNNDNIDKNENNNNDNNDNDGNDNNSSSPPSPYDYKKTNNRFNTPNTPNLKNNHRNSINLNFESFSLPYHCELVTVFGDRAGQPLSMEIIGRYMTYNTSI